MSVEVDHADSLELAEAAHALVQADASRAAAAARRALEVSRSRGAREAEVAALHALGFAEHELGDGAAVSTLRAAVRLGERHGLRRRAALARRTLAGCLADAGAIDAALRAIDAAEASLDGVEVARSEVFRVGILHLAGRAPASLDASERAASVLRDRGESVWEARLLYNRGLLLRCRGEPDAAEHDLRRARALYASAGLTAAAGGAELQLAMIPLLRGDLPAALAALDAVDANALSGQKRAQLELLRASALATGRLNADALAALARADELWRRAGVEDYEGRLEAIRLTILAGAPRDALALALRTQRTFAAQRRVVLAAAAAGLGLTAAIAASIASTDLVQRGRRATATLAAAGWHTDARRVQLAVARAAIELGSARAARRELAACSSLLKRGPIADRIEAWHVESLIRLAEGNPTGAQRAARNGLRVLEEHRAALGAAELRATASSIGADLAALGLRIALDRPRPEPVLAWAEALRASALRLAPVTPPDNPELRAALTELRQLSAELSRTEQAGRSTRSLLARQTRVETQVRRLSRHTPGEELPSRASPTRAQLSSTLGRRALVELVESGGGLTALTLVDGRLRRHELGSLAAVQDQLEWLRFGLARLAHLPRRAPQRESLAHGATDSAGALERTLLAPLKDAIGDRELVLVPTGELHALPWAMLPGLRGRAVSVAPSAAVWWALESRPRSRRRRVVAVAGPRLRHARPEVERVAEHHPAARALTGPAATVAATLRSLDGAAVAHLACHGHVRADSPLFSSLELADGHLNAYELARLRHAPELIVLSACDLAVSDARPGDELLGFAGALLDMGTRTIIASVVPVPDAAARRVMPALHDELVNGATPARALARAQARLPSDQAALAGFVCLGAGP